MSVFLPLYYFFFFPVIWGFTVFDSASQWSVLSSEGSAVRVVGDRTQFCLGALVLLYYLEYAPVSTTGGQREVGWERGGAGGGAGTCSQVMDRSAGRPA